MPSDLLTCRNCGVTRCECAYCRRSDWGVAGLCEDCHERGVAERDRQNEAEREQARITRILASWQQTAYRAGFPEPAPVAPVLQNQTCPCGMAQRCDDCRRNSDDYTQCPHCDEPYTRVQRVDPTTWQCDCLQSQDAHDRNVDIGLSCTYCSRTQDQLRFSRPGTILRWSGNRYRVVGTGMRETTPSLEMVEIWANVEQRSTWLTLDRLPSDLTIEEPEQEPSARRPNAWADLQVASQRRFDAPPDPPRVVSHRDITRRDQDRALHLRESYRYTWNQVADAMHWPRTTENGYSLARWAAYQARQRRGDDMTPRAVRGTRFGIEIEFNNGGCGDPDCDCEGSEDGDSDLQERVICHASQAGLNCQLESYGHAVRNYWKLVGDSTVSGGEFVSPPLDREAGMDQVRVALEAVRAAGGTPGQNQGMHVHHDASDLDRDGMLRLIDVLRVWQGAIMSAVPEYRWDGSNYCGASMIESGEWDYLIRYARDGVLRRNGPRNREELSVSRYRAFNFNATLAYGTVEFRGLGNTLNWSKVAAWIRVTGAIVEYARRGLPIPTATTGGLDTDHMLTVLAEHGLIDDRTAAKFARMASDTRRERTMAQLARTDRFAVAA